MTVRPDPQPLVPYGPADQTTYADDLAVGVEYPLGSYELTQAEILDFGRKWDPQFFHTDPQLAADSAFGSLAASGIQTVAIFQRLCVTGQYATWKMVAGKMVRDLRFHAPVRPGDVLDGRFVITDRVPAGRGRATISLDGELRNQDRVVVLRLTVDCVVEMRPESEPAETSG